MEYQKLIIAFVIIATVSILIYLILGNENYSHALEEDVEIALNFTGFDNLKSEESLSMTSKEENTVLLSPPEDYKNNHFIIYGASETGKTYWLKKHYLERYNINYLTYTSDISEWKESNILPSLDELFKIYTSRPSQNESKIKLLSFIFDDVENEIKNEQRVNDLFLNGRHKNIQCIIISHCTKLISNQIRQNISKILITTGNTPEFIKQLKETYDIRQPIENYVENYGMMLYNFRTRELLVNNKYGNQSQILNNDVLVKYKNNFNLSQDDKLVVKAVLEAISSTPIDIPEDLIYYYLNIYFLKRKCTDLNISKLRHIYRDKYDLRYRFSNFNNEFNKLPIQLNKIKKILDTSTDIIDKFK